MTATNPRFIELGLESVPAVLDGKVPKVEDVQPRHTKVLSHGDASLLRTRRAQECKVQQCKSAASAPAAYGSNAAKVG